MNRNAISGLVVSALLLLGIATHEGFVSKPYIPVPGDVPTIGYGTTVKADGTPVRMTDAPMTRAQAMEALRFDVSSKFEKGVKKCVKVPLYQYEYDAYVSLSYNIGVGGFCGSTIVKKLNRGDYAGACRGILNWDYFKGRKLRGLTNRRRAEYKMCVGG